MGQNHGKITPKKNDFVLVAKLGEIILKKNIVKCL
jgi:hypothetical protein